MHEENDVEDVGAGAYAGGAHIWAFFVFLLALDRMIIGYE